MRGLSDKFIISLKSELLQPVLERVKKDDTLMLGIRDGYFNIYYRGGNLLRITEKQYSSDLFFDKKYDLSEGHKIYNALNLPEKITDPAQLDKWVSSIALLKELMDFWFNKNPKMEREFQQLVERENNRSSISGESEYFITDIEFADSGLGARFDMLAICWLASQRKNGSNCRAALIEMKYGDGALGGRGGLLKHLQDIDTLISDNDKYKSLLETIESQFNQLDELGLLRFNRCSNGTKVKLVANDNPEVIFILANHNPRSVKLKNILIDSEFKKYIASKNFDLRFFVSSDAGYGMHNDNMLSYEQYISRFCE